MVDHDPFSKWSENVSDTRSRDNLLMMAPEPSNSDHENELKDSNENKKNEAPEPSSCPNQEWPPDLATLADFACGLRISTKTLRNKISEKKIEMPPPYMKRGGSLPHYYKYEECVDILNFLFPDRRPLPETFEVFQELIK